MVIALLTSFEGTGGGGISKLARSSTIPADDGGNGALRGERRDGEYDETGVVKLVLDECPGEGGTMLRDAKGRGMSERSL